MALFMDNSVLTTSDAKNLSLEEIFQKIFSSKTGLSSEDAKKRLEQFGKNEIVEKKSNLFLKFGFYFWGPIPWMIEIALILSALVSQWDDFWIILALLFLNVGVSFWEERKADHAIEALKQRLVQKAMVLRDNNWISVDSKELVPGDIARLRIGNFVPADVKIIEEDYVLADESSLTGESLPVEKHVSDIIFEGSIVNHGELTGIIVSTGMNTFFGHTAKLIQAAKAPSHLQEAIVKIGNFLTIFALVLVAIVFLVSLFRHENILEILQFSLILVVASIPVALPAVLSVTLAVGAIALAKKGAIVSKLAAIEELAGIDILCSDKTGTITKNQLSVAEIIGFNGFSEKDVLFSGVLASKKEDNDPIDNAIIEKAERENIFLETSKLKLVEFRSFDPITKKSEAIFEDNKGKKIIIAKGAPQSILALVQENKNNNKIMNFVEEFAKKGYRALGVAKKSGKSNWEICGLIALYDPPRIDSKETIQTAQSMGINVKMITGDHIAIAKETAKQVGLGTNIVQASSFINLSESEKTEIIENSDGFAEVYPENKFQIVEILQAKNHIIGMTGDGVNDAPALRKADAGIAVINATDAAKSVADIVFAQQGLSTIIDSIKESRKIFQRMTNYAIYRIAETIRILIFVSLSIIVFNFYPVSAVIIVLLAILNDVSIMTIAYDNVKYSDKPERWNMQSLLGVATFLGIIGVFTSFTVLYIGLEILKLPLATLQTFIYLKLSIAGHFLIFAARTKKGFWTVKPSKILLAAVLGTQTIATIIAVYGILLAPIGWNLAAIVWALAISSFLITDFLKTRFYKIFEQNP
ncbi:MAG: plasma-membrane proton-efflux P-type ATPase [Candidatus ainarchaeum sp.]|nr:plasma-membrane proton-efflux P-type ATPase [Candidatus ainarchaeum sp.]